MRPAGKRVMGSLVGFFVLLLLYAKLLPAPTFPLDRIRFLSEEQARFASMLVDPVSARFRAQQVSTLGGVAVVCGEVNARNETGGYAGFRRFITGATVSKVEPAPATSEMTELWHLMCGPPQP
jgi:hypothetical protein